MNRPFGWDAGFYWRSHGSGELWSLLPGIEMSQEKFVKVIPAAVGFGLGALFIFGLDKVLRTFTSIFKNQRAENPMASINTACPQVLSIISLRD